MKRILVGIAFAALAGVAACAPTPKAEPRPATPTGGAALAGGEWMVFEIGGQPIVADSKPSINFEESRVFGAGSCNRFMGGFTLDGASLRFGPTAGTRMACPPPAMEQERRFHEALEAVRGWQAEGDALLLTDGTGATVLRLLRGPAG